MCVLADMVYWLAMAYVWVVIAAAVLSWVGPDPTHPAVRLIYRLTDPVFQRVRRMLPSHSGIDFSPIVVCFVLLIVQFVVVNFLKHIGHC
jgi:YggT family protein